MTKSNFRNAMANFPSGVVIATTLDPDGSLKGFTASSFCSVSLEPAMVLVCLSRAAESWSSFEKSPYFAISVLRPEHEALALRFAQRGEEKFADVSAFEVADHGLAIMAGALATMVCRTADRHAAGDHTILVGEVQSTTIAEGGEAMLHFRRRFHRVDGPL